MLSHMTIGPNTVKLLQDWRKMENEIDTIIIKTIETLEEEIICFFFCILLFIIVSYFFFVIK
jgi:hypothetical protein